MALVLVMIFAALFYASGWTGIPIDDAAITYRYARNIALGRGFVYNIGERVQGTSTPLFTFILALPGVLGLDIHFFSALSGLFCALSCCYLVHRIGAITFSPVAGLLGALFLAFDSTFARWATAGMETPLYCALVLLALMAFLERKYMLMSCTLFFLTWVKLDGGVAVVVFFGALMVKERRIPWREALLYVLLVLPWFMAVQLYFGAIIPNSLLAKQNHLLWSNDFWFPSFFLRPSRLILAPFVLLGIASVLTKDRIRRDLVFILWPVSYAIAYTLARLDFYEWYVVPVLPLWALLTGRGIELLVRLLQKATATHALGLVALVLLSLNLVQFGQQDLAAFRDYVLHVEGTRLQIGQWLASSIASSESKIATGAIGIIGYVSDGYIIDLAGLVTPYAVNHSVYETLDYYKPLYVVGLDDCPKGTIFGSDSEFLIRYRLVQSFEGSAPFCGLYKIFERTDSLQ